MNIKKINLIYIVVFFFCSACVVNVAQAIPFVASPYGSIAGSFIRDRYDGKDLNNIKNDLLDYKDTKKGVEFAIGVASRFPIPVINNLRFEINYSYQPGKNNSSLTGGSLYYDIKNFPIVTPYFGVSLFYYNPKVAFNRSNSVRSTISQGLTGFNIGLSVGLPLFPLEGFIQYRYAIPGLFGDKSNVSTDQSEYTVKNYKLSMFTIGARLYFL